MTPAAGYTLELRVEHMGWIGAYSGKWVPGSMQPDVETGWAEVRRLDALHAPGSGRKHRLVARYVSEWTDALVRARDELDRRIQSYDDSASLLRRYGEAARANALVVRADAIRATRDSLSAPCP